MSFTINSQKFAYQNINEIQKILVYKFFSEEMTERKRAQILLRLTTIKQFFEKYKEQTNLVAKAQMVTVDLIPEMRRVLKELDASIVEETLEKIIWTEKPNFPFSREFVYTQIFKKVYIEINERDDKICH